MFFDDRLATVLRHRATSERGARTQFRQLLDLLGNRKHGRDESLLAAAWLRLGALGEQIPASERARILREPGWRFRNPQLAAHLAEDEPEVAAAALSGAQLDEEDWVALIPRLPIRARGFLRLRRDLPPRAERLLEQLGIHDRGLPDPGRVEIDIDIDVEIAPLDLNGREAPDDDFEAPPIPEREPERASAPIETPSPRQRPSATSGIIPDEKSEIAALVERIAQFRRDRGAESAASDLSPRLPLGEKHVLPEDAIIGFAFTSDTSGRIDWADPQVASMVIGQRLFARTFADTGTDTDPIADSFAHQQPIEGQLRTLEGASAIRGEWIVDAHPQFSATGGRFHGYVGRFRRPFDPGSDGMGGINEADRIRQLLHELRTPVNAVQGFAELIHQQLYGPVPNAYRALAATIAGDAASILAGFDEIERLAKLESGVISVAPGKTDMLDLVRRMTTQLTQVLTPRMAGIDLAQGPERSLWVEIDRDEAEALIWRVLATLAGAVTAGEMLAAEIRANDDVARLWCQIPAQLIAEDDVFAAEIKPAANGLSSGLFGAGFSLRLARAEARGAGGDLQQHEDQMCLSLPLTAVSHGETPAEDHRASEVG